MTKVKDTSRRAFGEANASGLAPSLREQVYAVIAGNGAHGATDQEVQRILGLTTNVETPRRNELVAEGRVFDSGRERKNRSGLGATVWVADERHVYKAGVKKKRKGSVRNLKRTLLMAAPSHQGGHSDVGEAIAEIFDIAFPLRMQELERVAREEGFDPDILWPWHASMKASRGR